MGMTTTVDFHRALEADLVEWATSDPPRQDDRVTLWARVYRPEIEAALRATGGDPTRLAALGVEPAGYVSPPAYDWPFTADLWVRFAVRTRKPLLRPAVCRITVLRLSLERLPSPGG